MFTQNYVSMKKYTIGFALTLLTLLLQIQAFAQCQAGFNISSINGLEVSFINESADSTLTGGGLPDTQWDFGDGFSFSGYDVTHTFPMPGTYEVCVTATTPTSGCTDTYCLDIMVGIVECSSFEIEVSNNVGGAVGIEGAIYNVTDFGPYEPDVVEWYVQELGLTIANTPTFSFSPPPIDPTLNYTICVDYEIDGLICSGLCAPLNPPASNCNDFTMDVVVNGGLEISGGVYDSAGNTPIMAEWYVQELNFVFANTPTFTINLPPTTFPVQDNYTVCVDFEDDGVPCTLCEVYTIGAGTCAYAFDTNVNGMEVCGELLPAPGAIPPDSIIYIFDGGSSTIGTGNDFCYTFTDPGNYEICAIYEVNGVCSGFLCDSIVIGNPLGCDFYIGYTINNGMFEGEFYAINNLPLPYVAAWTIQGTGDTISSGTTLTYPFTSPGTYTICADYVPSLDNPCSGQVCESIIVQLDVCVVDFTYSLDANNLLGVFDVLPIGPPFSETFPDNPEWFIDGNSIGTGSPFSYQFPAQGTYEVCLLVDIIDINGAVVCQADTCQTIQVGSGADCEVGFFYNVFGYDATFQIDCPTIPEISCSNVEWEIDNTTGTGNSFDYTLPPGTSSIYACMTAEIFDITTGISCLVDTCQLIEIPCEVLEFTTDTNGPIGVFEVIQPPVFPGFAWYNPVWYIDGDSVESANILDYQFSGTGFYEVCLSADLIDFEGNFQCYQETCATVEIESPNDPCEAGFEYEINGGIGIFEIACSDVPEITCSDVVWTMGNDTIGVGSPFTYALPATDSFELCMFAEIIDITTGVMCQAETCEMIATQPDCMDLEFSSTLNGLDGIFELIQTPANILEWVNPVWYIDGDSMEAVNIFDYQFPSAGLYEVCLIADLVDLGLNYICTQEVCETIEIQGGGNLCEAYFEWEEFTGGSGYGVLFENGSTGNYTEAVWTFGDGSTEVTTSNIVDYAYNNPGMYTVCLTIFDAATGCQDSYCEDVLVSGQPNCDYEVTYTLSGNIVELVISDSMINYPAVAEWYDPATGNVYGNGNDVTITLPGIGTYEICVDYENPGTACFGTICTTVTINDPDCTATDCVFPGDTNGDFVANNFDVLPVGLEYGATGPLRANASTAWYGQVATDWAGTTADGINQKHVDCDGDGNIDFPDIDAIQLNYNRTHDGLVPTNLVETPEIWLNFNLDTISVDMAVGNTVLIEADIMLATDAMPAEDIYGIAFSINYPSALVVEGSAAGAYYNDSWFGDGSTTLQLEQDVYTQGMIDFGYSRIDQQNISGFGQIGTVSFVMTDNIIGSFGRSVDVEEVLLNFYVTDIRVVNNAGELQNFSGSQAQVLLLNETTNAIINPDLSNFISVYPNPVSQTLHIQSEIINTERIMLYDAVGRIILDKNTSGQHEQLDVADLPTGVYILSIYTKEGLLNKKIVIE